LQLTCSQPFSACSCFGLSFICLHKPQGQEPDPHSHPWAQWVMLSSDRPWCSSPAFHRAFFPESHIYRHPPARLPLPVPRRSREEKQLRSRLWRLEGAAWSPAHLSHSAWMVLVTAQNQNQALRPRAG
ncbi:TRPC2 protein, partial [Cardinalis cardinalis]|nr:TRPC2 protein [Cardinalis cardinalis]